MPTCVWFEISYGTLGFERVFFNLSFLSISSVLHLHTQSLYPPVPAVPCSWSHVVYCQNVIPLCVLNFSALGCRWVLREANTRSEGVCCLLNGDDSIPAKDLLSKSVNVISTLNLSTVRVLCEIQTIALVWFLLRIYSLMEICHAAKPTLALILGAVKSTQYFRVTVNYNRSTWCL